MTFQPGKSGNPGGRSREKLIKTALDMELARAGDSLAGLRKVWKPIVEKAWEGDLACAKEIFDRREGKAVQALIGGDEDDPAIKLTGITVEFVKAAHPDTRCLPPPDDRTGGSSV